MFQTERRTASYIFAKQMSSATSNSQQTEGSRNPDLLQTPGKKVVHDIHICCGARSPQPQHHLDGLNHPARRRLRLEEGT